MSLFDENLVRNHMEQCSTALAHKDERCVIERYFVPICLMFLFRSFRMHGNDSKSYTNSKAVPKDQAQLP